MSKGNPRFVVVMRTANRDYAVLPQLHYTPAQALEMVRYFKAMNPQMAYLIRKINLGVGEGEIKQAENTHSA